MKDHCPQTFIVKHECEITEGVRLTVGCNVKSGTVRFKISGMEEFVLTCSNQELNFCYGFMRLHCDDNDSEIKVTLRFPAINDEGSTNSFVLVAIDN